MVDGNITVIDSKSISFGLGYQIKQIVELISQGTSTEEIVKEMTQLRDNLQLFVVIGQLNQLIKGGRISKKNVDLRWVNSFIHLEMHIFIPIIWMQYIHNYQEIVIYHLN